MSVDQALNRSTHSQKTQYNFANTSLRAILVDLPIHTSIIPCYRQVKEITTHVPALSTNCPKALESLLIECTVSEDCV